ncbi:hypothetical protein JXQ31_14380 [candidate division KSB1 bacterium]|nr:hypothetical protein [candidate division KSB1 bacterium]
MRKIYLLTHPLLIAFIIFNICNDDGIFEPGGDNTIVLGDTLNVGYGTTLQNIQEHIWITFDSVYEDSRCPLNVDCVWAGNAKLGFTFKQSIRKTSFSLNTHANFKRDTTVYFYQISLIDVLPYPHSDSTNTAKDYTAQIVVKKE